MPMPTPTSTLHRTIQRVATTVAGTLVVAAGVAMLVLPGPGLVTIALGLSILGREHAWAAALEHRIRTRIATALHRRPITAPAPPPHTDAHSDHRRSPGTDAHSDHRRSPGTDAHPVPGTAWDPDHRRSPGPDAHSVPGTAWDHAA